MNLPIVLRDEAQAEFDEAFDWHEVHGVGGGPAFAAEVQKVFDRIAANLYYSDPDREGRVAIDWGIPLACVGENPFLTFGTGSGSLLYCCTSRSYSVIASSAASCLPCASSQRGDSGSFQYSSGNRGSL